MTTATPHHVIPGGLSAKNLAEYGWWRASAACCTADPEMFFEASTADATADRYTAAKKICRTCPVVQECLAIPLDSVGQWTNFGVWGGLTAGERQDRDLVSRVMTFGAAAIPDLYWQLCAHCNTTKLFAGSGRAPGQNWFCRAPACRRASTRTVPKPQAAA